MEDGMYPTPDKGVRSIPGNCPQEGRFLNHVTHEGIPCKKTNLPHAMPLDPCSCFLLCLSAPPHAGARAHFTDGRHRILQKSLSLYLAAARFPGTSRSIQR